MARKRQLLANIVALNGLDMKKKELLVNTFVINAKSIGPKKIVLLTINARPGHRGSQLCCLEKMANLAL